MVFQDFRLISGKTVYENIAFTMEAAGRSDEEIEEDVPHVLELVDLGRQDLELPPRALRRGEAACGHSPRARQPARHHHGRRADREPRPGNTYDIVQILKKINDFGTTVILTTHNKGIIDS
jgi:cell division transport system ATP-binding protein